MNSPYLNDLTKFIEGVNVKIETYWNEQGLTYNTPGVVQVVSVGKRYAKLAKMERKPWKTGPLVAASVYCFFDIFNGNLHKGTWSAPVNNGVRGNVTDPNVLDTFDWHGPKYLR